MAQGALSGYPTEKTAVWSNLLKKVRDKADKGISYSIERMANSRRNVWEINLKVVKKRN
jgi:hypothetical protein